MKKPTVICPYCGRAARLVDSARVYGTSYGKIWLCSGWPICDAYVGVHSCTHAPLGRLANPELRAAKKAAHAVFDPLWKRGMMSRSEAYTWLAEQLGISMDECHIGMFDVDLCKRVCCACEASNGR